MSNILEKIKTKISSFFKAILRGILGLASKFADVVYNNRSNSWKAAATTSFWVFTAGFFSATASFLGGIESFLSGEDTNIFDDVRVYGRALLSAAFAIFTGLLNYGYRIAQAKGRMPGTTPQYDSNLLSNKINKGNIKVPVQQDLGI